MIQIKNRNIVDIRLGTREIMSVYLGTRLIWEKLNEILSCFSNGYWTDDYPWVDNETWTD